MAKAKKAATDCGPSETERHKWEVEDALRALTRAQEVIKDSKLMADVKKLARERMDEMSAITGKTAELVKKGLISEKAAAKMGKRG